MIITKEIRDELEKRNWYSLGYSDYPNYEFTKDLRCVTKNMTRGRVKANINPDRGVRFIPCGKKKFDEKDAEAMTKLISEFMRIMGKHGFTLG